MPVLIVVRCESQNERKFGMHEVRRRMGAFGESETSNINIDKRWTTEVSSEVMLFNRSDSSTALKCTLQRDMMPGVSDRPRYGHNPSA